MSKSRKKRLVLGLSIVAVLAVLLSPLCDAPPLSTGAYVQAVTSREAVIIQVLDAAGDLSLEFQGAGDIERVVDGSGRRFEWRLYELRPDMRYKFAVKDAEGVRVDEGSFVTHAEEDSSPVRFSFVGDSGGQPWWIFALESPLFRMLGAHRWMPTALKPAAIGAALAESKPEWWIHVGDLVYPKGEQKHYRTGFFEPFAEALRSGACYPVLGNHDVRADAGAAFTENFVLPGESDHHFTFRDGPLRVIGVDFNSTVTSDHPSYRYLQYQLERVTEPWIIVVSHFPVHSVYREAPREDLLNVYLPLCKKHGVDLILSGHDHNYQRFGQPGELIEIVSGGGGKSLYDVKHRPEGLAVAQKAYHYCKVEIDGPVLRLEAVGIDGAMLDVFTIDKREYSEEQLKGEAARIARVKALIE